MSRAQLGTALAWIVATIIAIIFVVFAFFISKGLVLTKIKIFEEKIGEYESKKMAEFSLKNFLSTKISVEIEGKEENISMLMLFDASQKNKDYKKIFIEKAEEIFSPYKNCWKFKSKNFEIGKGKSENYFLLDIPLSTREIDQIKFSIERKCM